MYNRDNFLAHFGKDLKKNHWKVFFSQSLKKHEITSNMTFPLYKSRFSRKTIFFFKKRLCDYSYIFDPQRHSKFWKNVFFQICFKALGGRKCLFDIIFLRFVKFLQPLIVIDLFFLKCKKKKKLARRFKIYGRRRERGYDAI